MVCDEYESPKRYRQRVHSGSEGVKRRQFRGAHLRVSPSRRSRHVTGVDREGEGGVRGILRRFWTLRTPLERSGKSSPRRVRLQRRKEHRARWGRETGGGEGDANARPQLLPPLPLSPTAEFSRRGRASAVARGLVPSLWHPPLAILCSGGAGREGGWHRPPQQPMRRTPQLTFSAVS